MGGVTTLLEYNGEGGIGEEREKEKKKSFLTPAQSSLRLLHQTW
jgi:hypothetical protein